ncbi:MAG: cytidylate kinase-like family protein [Nitrospiraceae bacterium]|nr:MAG: cytidylate kinase-like family protein [Nitrospiraceae bacterium]
MAILTISREFGSGGREIGHAVAALLNYEYVDKERLLADLKASGPEWEKWGKELDEHCPTVWEKHDWSFRGFSALIQSCILDHALKGNVVLMGRGGNFLLKDIQSAFRVRIIAPLEKRIERITMRESVDRETAKWLIKKTDTERECFIRSIYGKELNNPDEYDIILDAGKRQEEEIINIISENLQEREQIQGDNKTLSLRAEAARLKAGLLTNSRLFVPTLEVFHEGDSLVLRGIVHNPKEHKVVEEEAKRLTRGRPVRCELHYRK